MKISTFLPALALAALLAPATAGSAQAAVRTGTLTCDIGGGIGVVLGSRKSVSCRFSDFNGYSELYDGTITKVGVDVGFTFAGRMVWAVFEPSNRHAPLGGNYAGVSAEASAALGVGANVLLGGGNGGITLQPLSVQGQTGLNASVGIGSLHIRPVAAPVIIQAERVHRPRHKAHRHHYTGKHRKVHHRKGKHRRS